MLTRLSLSFSVNTPVLVMAVVLTLGLITPGLAQSQAQNQTRTLAQNQVGDEALRDTISDPAVAEPDIADATQAQIVPPNPLPAAIFLRIEYDEGSLSGGDADARMLDLYEFYDGRFYEPVWVGDSGANAKARALAEELRAAEDHGLDPTDYGAAVIATLINSKSPQGLADLEVRLSKAVLDYGRDLSVGRVEPSSINKEIAVFPKGPDASELLLGVIASDDVRAYLGALAPRSDNYRRLKNTLAAYQAIAAQGGWTRVSDGEVLKPGMSHPRVFMVGQRMLEAGLIEPTALPQGESPPYDNALVAAIRTFQMRHGLEVDGIIGPGTLGALNASVEERIGTMVLNMERRRWMMDDLGKSYVFVNLADFELKFVRDKKTVHTARVVIGKTYHRTPVFSEDMTYMVLNPYWHIPPSIAKSELLPKLIDNPGALKDQSIRILNGWNENAREVDPWSVNWQSYRGRAFPFKLRQDPGGKNALGRIKFMFPNKFNVYLHDTPSKALFARNVRSFSHGCVRVQNPVDLATAILALDGIWTGAKIKATLAAGRKRVVKLSTPVPVHVTYLTSWVNKDGSVHFRDDIYDRDKALAEALRRTHQLIN